jgi:protein YibB
MGNITIVTSFFDIGRSEWTPDKGLPHFLHRSTETYLERFSYLAKIENEMVVFTTKEYAPRIAEYRKDNIDKTKVVVVDHPRISFASMREKIEKVQRDPNFQRNLTPYQRAMPESWSPDFCLVTDLKAYYTNQAVENNYVSNDLVSWIDFGYARTPEKVSKSWSYNFNPEKIHIFPDKELGNRTVAETIYQGDVIVFGAFVVTHKKLWPKMSELMFKSFDMLYEQNVVDDDQGLWLQSSLLEPHLFESHMIPDHRLGHDPFVIFEKFNQAK